MSEFVQTGGRSHRVSLRLSDEGRALVRRSPADGSQDFYVSVMLGVPKRRVRELRELMAGGAR